MLKRIIIHWSAGSYEPNKTDKAHYHYLITGDSEVINGVFTPEDNLNCYDGKYAKHTGGGNTGSVGIAFCAMLGFISANNVGEFPIKKAQLEAGLCFIASLCKEYDLTVSSNTVLTHYEFGLAHPNTSSKGKIDISHLPPFPNVMPDEVGDFLRRKVKWYLQRL